MIKVDWLSWVIVKQHDILTHCIARSVPLFWAPFLTQNLVLVFTQVDMKDVIWRNGMPVSLNSASVSLNITDLKVVSSQWLYGLTVSHIVKCHFAISCFAAADFHLRSLPFVTNNCFGTLYLNSRGRHVLIVGGVMSCSYWVSCRGHLISWGRHDCKSLKSYKWFTNFQSGRQWDLFIASMITQTELNDTMSC